MARIPLLEEWIDPFHSREATEVGIIRVDDESEVFRERRNMGIGSEISADRTGEEHLTVVLPMGIRRGQESDVRLLQPAVNHFDGLSDSEWLRERSRVGCKPKKSHGDNVADSYGLGA